jgi:hypothetical protein
MTTKYTDAELKAEINRLLDDLEADHKPLRPQWVTHEICLVHQPGLVSGSVHAPFWEYSGYTITRKLSTACINERLETIPTDENEPKPQRFPGFERIYLQDHYVVMRDGVDEGIPVLQCTDDELYAKAALYRSQSRKLIAHADEIERFIAWRSAHSLAAGQ